MSILVHPTPHDVHTTNISLLNVTEVYMEENLVQMENVLNITNTCQALSESLRTHVGSITGENRPIFQAPI